MNANLVALNRFIAEDHWIDLLIPDRESKALSQGTDEEQDAFGERSGSRKDLDLLGRSQLYRVFNNSTFGNGGRFYGGWWQEIPSRYRRFITINGYPTAELDYSNLQIAMLYAREGLKLEGDAYSIDGVPPEFRKLIKLTTLKIINAEGRIKAPRKDMLPPRVSWRDLQSAIKEKHTPIDRYFNTGVGIELQRRDADIAEEVMLTLMAEGTLALPVHDSFIVEDGRQDRLKQVMSDAYRRLEGQAIEIDADTTWHEENLPENAQLLHDLGVKDLEEYVSEVEEGPDYRYYLERRRAFIRQKGERWVREHRIRI